MESVLLARTVREEVSDELRNRLMPSVVSFLNDEIEVVESFIFECSSELQKAQLARLNEDLKAIRQAVDALIVTSSALLQDR